MAIHNRINLYLLDAIDEAHVYVIMNLSRGNYVLKHSLPKVRLIYSIQQNRDLCGLCICHAFNKLLYIHILILV